MVQSAARWISDHQRGAHAAAASAGSIPGRRHAWDGDPDLESVARSWLAELPQRLEELAAALSVGDHPEVARRAHAIKGSGGTLGFPEFTSPADLLEIAAARGDREGAARHLGALWDHQRAAAEKLSQIG